MGVVFQNKKTYSFLLLCMAFTLLIIIQLNSTQSNAGLKQRHKEEESLSSSLPPSVRKKKLSITKYEEFVADVLACYQTRRRDNVNYLYSTELNKCVPFPNKNGWEGHTFINPPDVTSVPLLKYQFPTDWRYYEKEIYEDVEEEQQQHRKSAGGPASSSLSSSSEKAIREKFSPSMYARFLFDDWRLWEGELDCKPDEEDGNENLINKGEEGNNSIKSKGIQYNTNINITTRGYHNAELPNSVYQLDNFCIDELGGGLLGFKEASSDMSSPLPIDRHEGITEHPYGGLYHDFERFVHPLNHEQVNIVAPENEQLSSKANVWKSTIAASLEKHFEDRAELPPSVLFVEDPTLIVSLNTGGHENPIHQYHRYASSSALASFLNVSTLLYLMSLAADDAKYHFHRHSTKIFMLENTTIAGKLPSKLRTPEEEAEMERMPKQPEEFDRRLVSLNEAINLPWYAAELLPDRSPPKGPLSASGIAYHEIVGKTQNVFSYYGHHAPASLSDADGCEEFRCSSDKPQCTPAYRLLHRRCARPFAVIANTLPLVQNVNATSLKEGGRTFPNHDPFPEFIQYRPDTFNYSRDVWNIACIEAIREGKRMRRDVLMTKMGRPLPTDNELRRALHIERIYGTQQLGKYQYLAHWRDRLIRRLASVDQPRLPSFDESFLAMEFAEEYHSSLLERNHIREQEGKLKMPWKKARRQLICYKKAYASHVYYKDKPFEKKTQRGSLGMLVPANCNTREVLNITYNALQNKYGMCTVRSDAKSQQQKPPSESKTKKRVLLSQPVQQSQNGEANRDAHPVFLLANTERKKLQSSFEKSKVTLNDIVVEASEQLQKLLLISNLNLQTSSEIETQLIALCTELIGRVDRAQRTYDDQFMMYFDRHQSAKKGRPLRLIFAQRSFKRPLQQIGLMFSKLLDDGVGRFVELEVVENSATDMYSVDDPFFDFKQPMTTPKARQQNTLLTADMLLGVHGAEMYKVANLKPSAMAIELSIAGFDVDREASNSGYFAPLAFGRNIGFLKILIHSFEPMVVSSYISLPELRQTLSTGFCSWLAFNAVRLTDETASAKDKTNFDHLTPWWCRGGPLSVVRKLLSTFLNHSSTTRNALASASKKFSPLWKAPPRSEPTTTNSSTTNSLDAETNEENHRIHQKMLPVVLRHNFYSSSTLSSYGLTIPNCPVFEPHLSISDATKEVGKKVVINSTLTAPTFTRHHLNLLPSQCAAPITLGAHGRIPIQNVPLDELMSPQLRLKVLGLHSLLETVLFIDAAYASFVSRLMIQGIEAVLRYEQDFDFMNPATDVEFYSTETTANQSNNSTSLINITCGELPLNITGEDDDNTADSRVCLSLMLQALLAPSGNTCTCSNQKEHFSTPSRFYSLSPSLLSAFELITHHQSTYCASFKVADDNLRGSLINWIVREFFEVPGKPVRNDLEPYVHGEEFSYGFNCSQFMP